ncbi:Putative E3 ubiquitin-protein ligase ELL [Septoria linicola]|uniref:E3 ubiquitin-protein ligase ELL n=1 Tax=Septoria linicola TaxID=215465 RepID=A0A9Q9ELR5_9PEZI|nr:putative E3 ubiquitin-protein ligase ELL [Septoria linicola]USW53703.1 Putative E3 ubiquitin-protein ligase ELL [Septoria linicola]
MSVSAIPPSGLSLHGIASRDASLKLRPPPAILFKLSEDLVEDVKKASTSSGGLQLVTGTTPKIRLGKRTIDLTISPEAFEHELFSAAKESLTDLTFAGIVGHRAELKAPERKQSVGSDAALAALQRNLASYHQEKAAKSVTVSSSLISTPRNRFEANRDQKYAHRRGLSGSQHASPSLSASSTPRPGGAPTSAPSSDPTLRLKAMRKPLIHLLAIEPLSQDEIMQKTRIPKADLEEILSKIGKIDGKKTGLSDRAYKELDVWSFAYSTQEERQAAIDNAVKAYDRQRIGKEEKIWQSLLPEERRNKGEYLSKLHIGAPTHLTPNVGASPMPHIDIEEKIGSAAGTPRLGAGTPKVGPGKSDLMKKLAKNPKQRAIDEAKEKKRKEREAAKADSDREGRPAKKARTTVVKSNPKVKSAELVQSSSEDEVAEARDGGTSSSQPKSAPNKRGPATNASAKTKSKPMASASASSSDVTEKRAQSKSTPLAKAKASTPIARSGSAASSTTKSKAAALGKNTPNGLHAPASQQRSQLSPNKPHHRPSAPSPLGAARPRVASDVSDRAAIGIQRSRPGADTPKGLGISNISGIRKRHDTITSTSTDSSSQSDRINGDRVTNERARKSLANGNGTGSSSSSLTNSVNRKTDGVAKRKAVDSPQHEGAGHAVKHRKTESSSSHSQNSVSAGSSNNSDHGRLTPARGGNIRMSFVQGVDLAQKFREELYPAYAKLFDELEAMQKRGDVIPATEKDRLWKMHRRLEQVKREINDASARDRED